MTVTHNNFRFVSLRRRLILLALAVGLMCFSVFRLFINPHFLTSYWFDSLLNNETANVLMMPSLSILWSVVRFAPGASKNQILTLLGAPRFKERKLNFKGCPAAVTAADEVWFYEVASHNLFLLGFKGDRCIIAGSLGEQCVPYCDWKAAQIRKLAVGQTPAQMESWLGSCFIKNPEFVRWMLTLTGRIHDTDEPWIDRRGQFYISSGDVIVIDVKDGHFANAEACSVFH